MEIKQETLNGIEIFSVKGRLDSTTSTTFENLISTNLSQGKKQILFDLEELDYISSAGLRVILKTMKDLQRADGRCDGRPGSREFDERVHEEREYADVDRERAVGDFDGGFI